MSISGIAKRFRDAEVPTRAAALAYHTLIGILPLFGFILSYLELIGVAKPWRDLAKKFLLSHFNAASSPEFLKQFNSLTAAAQGRGSTLLGWAVFLFASYSLVTKLGNSLDLIFETSLESPRSEKEFWKLWLRRLLVIGILPIVMTVSSVTASWLQKDSWLRELFGFSSVGSFLAFPIPIAVDIFALYMVYHYIPKKPGPWQASLRAAAIVGPVFWGMKLAVTVYNRHALASLQLYGAVAALLLFAIWIQMAWIMVLTGALFIQDRKGTRDRRLPPSRVI